MKYTELDGQIDYENGIPFCRKGDAYARGYFDKYTNDDLRETRKMKRKNDGRKDYKNGAEFKSKDTEYDEAFGMGHQEKLLREGKFNPPNIDEFFIAELGRKAQ